VKKKAAICLLRMYRKSPDSLPVGDWAKGIIPLISDADLGVSSSVVTLVTAFAQQYPQEYSGCIQKTIERLDQLLQGNVRPDYEYYKIPSPWLQVKCLRLLQCYPPRMLYFLTPIFIFIFIFILLNY
jgi:AP-2 complex subunit alpha